MSQNGKYKKLLGNSVIFAIGNLGSKLISFIMLPLYTYKLSTEQYGTADLISTTVTLLLPVVTLSIFESVLRFAMDSESDKRKIFSNSLAVTFFGNLFVFIFVLVSISIGNRNLFFLLLLLMLQSIQSLLAQYAKAIGLLKEYAFNGILMTVVTSLMNILLLIIFDYGITGYLISIVLTYIVSILFFSFKLDLKNTFNRSSIDYFYVKKMLSYSIPLIPNSIAIWFTNMVSRYFILFFLGASANGIFAVANKIPVLLTTLHSLFYQSWQLSAIEEYEHEGKSQFYTNVFSLYSQLLFLGITSILVIVKPMIEFTMSGDFSSAWKYVPFLLLTVAYSSFSSFLGTNYIAAKATKGALYTTSIGATLNIGLNLLFIPTLGLYGAGMSSSISFFVLWLIRVKHTKKYIHIQLNISNLILNNLVILIQIILLFVLNGWILLFGEILMLTLSLFVNKGLIQSIFDLVKKMALKKRVK
ncbi:lipopolysaccharide biosynthesis protein [Enterococcus sp. AZ192]|uniref:lipopolysaccharide biosynthesis protein n=1 Tax=unclassified Enterococcus TaxID=2608891 RepID=UPI003D2E5D5C